MRGERTSFKAADLPRGSLPDLNRDGGFMGPQHLFPISSTFRPSDLPVEAGVMDACLMIIAWGAGLASLFLVADMIKTDLTCRKADRAAAGEPRFALPRRLLRSGGTQDGVDLALEGLGGERLDDVIADARHLGRDHVLCLVRGRGHDERQMAKAHVGAHRFQ